MKLIFSGTSTDGVHTLSCHVGRAFLDPAKEFKKFSGISQSHGLSLHEGRMKTET